MKFHDLLADWGVSKLKLKAGFLEAEFTPSDEERLAAWALYIELVTRVSTQQLGYLQGDEKAALSSLYSLFPTTRAVLKEGGPRCHKFSIVAVAVLNEVLRPFLANWHPVFESAPKLGDVDKAKFRAELDELRKDMDQYSTALRTMSGV